MRSERIKPVSGWNRRIRCDLVCAQTLRELRESRAHADGNAAALFNPRGRRRERGRTTWTVCGSAWHTRCPPREVDPGVRESHEVLFIALEGVSVAVIIDALPLMGNFKAYLKAFSQDRTSPGNVSRGLRHVRDIVPLTCQCASMGPGCAILRLQNSCLDVRVRQRYGKGNAFDP